MRDEYGQKVEDRVINAGEQRALNMSDRGSSDASPVQIHQDTLPASNDDNNKELDLTVDLEKNGEIMSRDDLAIGSYPSYTLVNQRNNNGETISRQTSRKCLYTRYHQYKHSWTAYRKSRSYRQIAKDGVILACCSVAVCVSAWLLGCMIYWTTAGKRTNQSTTYKGHVM